MKTTRQTQRFSKHNQPVKCRGCGKLTTTKVQGVVGTDLCSACLDNAGLENEHNDGGHEFHPDCPVCKSEKGGAS